MKKILTLLFLNFTLFVYGQKQGNIWYFGGEYSNQSATGAGLDFNSGSPVALLNSAMTYTEGSATYCNSGGQLLFYAKGETVYDRTHTIMQNGDTLGGHWSTMQSALIVPVTGDTNLYYIFNNDGHPTSNGTGLYYSKIDMSLNSGLGGVLNPKAVNLLTNTSEHLTGCKHANGTDFWVITNDYFSTAFSAFRVSAAGVDPAVYTDLGFNAGTIGVIEISPLANKVALKLTGGPFNGDRMLVDFDNATGIFSNPYPLGPGGGTSAYNTACGFSPDGNLFYDIEKDNGADTLYQYDLNAPNIIASKTFAAALLNTLRVDMKTGPDGKIYFGGGFYDHYLEAINSPNTPGTGCNYQSNVAFLGSKYSGIMLPNELLIADVNSGSTEISVQNTFAVYPVPASVTATVDFVYQAGHEYVFLLYDEKARLVKTIRNINRGKVEIERNNLSGGTYYFILNDNKKSVIKEKLIFE
ncbi:MAG TPA: hypothetical protein VJY62_22710 [Bacteroidia bacterium]|nr:hypothetical protein [Bacteroidia bacterium]